MRFKLTFLPSRHTDGQKEHEKIYNKANYQRNGNQNYNELSVVRMIIIKISTNNKYCRGCEEKGIFLSYLW